MAPSTAKELDGFLIVSYATLIPARRCIGPRTSLRSFTIGTLIESSASL